MATNAKNIAELLEADGDVKSSALDNANVSIKVYSVKPATVTATGTSITVLGEGFVNGATVHFISSEDGSQTAAASVSYVSATQLTITNPELKAAAEPWSIKVTNPNGQSAAIESIIDAGGVPAWTTNTGKIGDDAVFGDPFSTTVAASDPEGTAIVYSESGTDVLTGSGSGKLGLTLNSSTGAITGTMPAGSSNTTFNFTLAAASGGDTTTRNFNIVGIVAHPDFYIFRGDGEGGTGTSDTSVWAQTWTSGGYQHNGSYSSSAGTTHITTKATGTGATGYGMGASLRSLVKLPAIPSSHNRVQIKSSVNTNSNTGGTGNNYIILSSTPFSTGQNAAASGATYPGAGWTGAVNLNSTDETIVLPTTVQGGQWYWGIVSYGGQSMNAEIKVTVLRTYYQA